MTSPVWAYFRMLRAISDIAAAMTVWSPRLKPAPAARSRPSWRAVSTSASDAIGTCWRSTTGPRPLHALCEKLEPFLEIERNRHTLQVQAELHHREGHLRLEPHDDRLGTTQRRHLGEVPRRAHGKGVHHVERGHVNNRALRAKPPDALTQPHPQLGEIRIRQRGLDGGDEILALLQDR